METQTSDRSSAAGGPHFNALKHGQYAKSLLLPDDDPAAFQRHRLLLFLNYRPQTKDEADLVHTLAENEWHLRRYAPVQSQADGQAVTPEADAAGRVCEPVAHQRLHSGMDVTVQRQRISRMWHRTRGELRVTQQQRRLGLVAGAVKLPADCYMETDGRIYGPIVQQPIVPLPVPAIEADKLSASDSNNRPIGFYEEQQKKGNGREEPVKAETDNAAPLHVTARRAAQAMARPMPAAPRLAVAGHLAAHPAPWGTSAPCTMVSSC